MFIGCEGPSVGGQWCHMTRVGFWAFTGGDRSSSAPTLKNPEVKTYERAVTSSSPCCESVCNMRVHTQAFLLQSFPQTRFSQHFNEKGCQCGLTGAKSIILTQMCIFSVPGGSISPVLSDVDVVVGCVHLHKIQSNLNIIYVKHYYLEKVTCKSKSNVGSVCIQKCFCWLCSKVFRALTFDF